MGKSTIKSISMVIFNSYVTNYQRVGIVNFEPLDGLRCFGHMAFTGWHPRGLAPLFYRWMMNSSHGADCQRLWLSLDVLVQSCAFSCVEICFLHMWKNHLRLLRSMHRKHALKQVFCLNGNLFETRAQGAAFRHGTAWCSSTALAAFKIDSNQSEVYDDLPSGKLT
jgi:hypothetical protein